jgi:H+-transporting ATPase
MDIWRSSLDHLPRLQPLTAIMTGLLLDDVPIMTIAYDNTPVAERPIRWHMPGRRAATAPAVQSFGLLLIGMEVLSDPSEQRYFGLLDESQLQSVMFLQLVAGGHLLLFVTRTGKWFFAPPYPARPLVIAIALTQILAVLMCGFGWLGPPIPWTLVGWIWLYNLIWLFALAGVRLAAEKQLAGDTARWGRSADLVSRPLQLPAAGRRPT